MIEHADNDAQVEGAIGLVEEIERARWMAPCDGSAHDPEPLGLLLGQLLPHVPRPTAEQLQLDGFGDPPDHRLDIAEALPAQRTPHGIEPRRPY